MRINTKKVDQYLKLENLPRYVIYVVYLVLASIAFFLIWKIYRFFFPVKTDYDKEIFDEIKEAAKKKGIKPSFNAKEVADTIFEILDSPNRQWLSANFWKGETSYDSAQRIFFELMPAPGSQELLEVYLAYGVRSVTRRGGVGNLNSLPMLLGSVKFDDVRGTLIEHLQKYMPIKGKIRENAVQAVKLSLDNYL